MTKAYKGDMILVNTPNLPSLFLAGKNKERDATFYVESVIAVINHDKSTIVLTSGSDYRIEFKKESDNMYFGELMISKKKESTSTLWLYENTNSGDNRYLARLQWEEDEYHYDCFVELKPSTA